MIPVALSLGVLIARVATVAAIPRAVGALRAFFCEPKTVERTSTAEKTLQSKTPPAIPATGTKEVVFTANSLNQRTSPGVNVYDAKGQTKDQNGRQFEWDDNGRLTAIIMDTHRSEFQYDGYGRRVRITEKENAVVESDKLYFWLGGEIVCERDATQPGNPITKRFFGQGVIADGQKLYYTFDQLGSVRELVDATGEVRADYRYSIYGERTKMAGDLDSDWGWAGLWHHEPSGLDLATYRAYDPTMGRWLSRDPLGEGVDLNLYRYCGNGPVGSVDPLGLKPDPLSSRTPIPTPSPLPSLAPTPSPSSRSASCSAPESFKDCVEKCLARFMSRDKYWIGLGTVGSFGIAAGAFAGKSTFGGAAGGILSVSLYQIGIRYHCVEQCRWTKP